MTSTFRTWRFDAEENENEFHAFNRSRYKRSGDFGRYCGHQCLDQGTADRVTGHWYYTLKLAPATTLASQYNLFNAALNDPDPYPLSTITGPPFPVLSKVETNIPSRCNNGLPPPYDTVVDSIGCFIQQDTIKSDVDIFLKYGYFEFSILSKVQWDGKMEAYRPGWAYRASRLRRPKAAGKWGWPIRTRRSVSAATASIWRRISCGPSTCSSLRARVRSWVFSRRRRPWRLQPRVRLRVPAWCFARSCSA